MTKLNQIIAVEKQVKATTENTITAVYHKLQKPPLYNGQIRTYRPHADDGVQLPGTAEVVQANVNDDLTTLFGALERQIDLTLTKDVANQEARADIVVGGTVLMAAVPVTTLLWLEKRIVAIRTVVSAVPLLDPTETWTLDADTGMYRSEPVETVRSKKVLRNHVKAKATDKHPEQVEVYSEDTTEGFWKTVKLSGATSASRRTRLLSRCDELSEAVKRAREEANSIPVTDRHDANGFLNYLFG